MRVLDMVEGTLGAVEVAFALTFFPVRNKISAILDNRTGMLGLDMAVDTQMGLKPLLLDNQLDKKVFDMAEDTSLKEVP